MEEQYLIWSNEHSAWWRSDSLGYTKVLEKAGKYPRSAALMICATARAGFKDSGIPSEIPVRWDDVIECLMARDKALQHLKSGA